MVIYLIGILLYVVKTELKKRDGHFDLLSVMF